MELGKDMVVGHVFGTGTLLISLHAGLMGRRVGEMQVAKTVCGKGAPAIRVTLRGAEVVNCVDLCCFSVFSVSKAGIHLPDHETSLYRML